MLATSARSRMMDLYTNCSIAKKFMVQDSTHADLINAIQNPQDYIQEILLPGNKNTQRAFINRVKFLMGQHDFMEELEKELISN